MPIAPWPEWLPDQPDFGGSGSPIIKNVLALTAKSYGPVLGPVQWSTNALTERCQGAYSIKAADGNVYVFAGDRAKLYQMPPGTTALADASRVAGGAYETLPPVNGGHWEMTSYGSRILATNGVDPIQSLLIGEPNFSDLQPGDPLGTPPVAAAPIAKYIATVKDFVFAANTTDPISGAVPYRVWWSGINDPTNWAAPGSVEAIQTQTDYQDLQQTDLGIITGLVSGFAPGSDVVIFCERGIYTASYTGPPLLFSFRVAQGASGTISPMSIVMGHARDNAGAVTPVVYYLGENGFNAFSGSASLPIGAQKWDKTFFDMVDHAYIGYVQGVADPRGRMIRWAFPTPGSDGMFTHVLAYNWELGRASLIELEPAQYREWMTSVMYGASFHLDNIDHLGDLDTIMPSFDDPLWTGNAASRLSWFDTTHMLDTSGGAAMAVTLETAEMQPHDGRRAWVSLVRPLTDGGFAMVSVGHRERLDQPVTWSQFVGANVLGECPHRTTGRYLRFRMQMPEGQPFRELLGLDLSDLRPEGKLR